MGKFNFEDYRQPWETGPHWELKKEFIETYEDTFEEDRLLCLAQAYANVVLMNCCYPDPVMQQISELSKPLQMRKKFQNTNCSSEATPKNEQPRVSEKLKSIYGQTGRPFKQVKFCASEDQYISSLSTESTNLCQSSPEKSKGTSSVLDLQDTQSLPSKSTDHVSDVKTETPPIRPVKNNISPDREKNEKIISALGLPLIQDFATMAKEITPKIGHPVGAIHCIINKLGLGPEYSFDIDIDPSSPKNTTLYKAKFLIRDCEIASSTANNKKNAKKLCSEAVIDTFFKLATSSISSGEEILELFSKNIVNRIKNELAIVTLKTVASLLDMDDYIVFDMISKKISPTVTEYYCKFILKDVLIAVGKDNISDNAKNMAADLGLMKLSNLSEYEIRSGELKKKHDINLASDLNSIPTQPCTKINIEKLPFILNKRMYNLSLRDGFVLIEKENILDSQRNEKTILHESASFNRKPFEYQFEDIPGTTPPSKRAVLLIAGAVVGTGVSATKEDAKTIASTNALHDLKKKYYTLRIKDEYIEGFIITRDQVFDGESYTSNVISESNIGCKMLKSMGWTGGGLGGKGIAEPIQATAKLSLGTGLGFERTKGHQNSPLFRKRMEAMLRDFCKSEHYSDLVFSKDFTKDERKEIHQLAARFHLHTQSRGVGSDRFLTIRQKYETTKLLKYLANNGGSNSKFELIDDSGFSLQK